MAKLEIDPVLAAAASFYKRLTTPDSEDWNVIVHLSSSGRAAQGWQRCCP
jgi:hypothetical protein